MSQLSSSQGLDQNLVSLSIAKFSHNTSPYGTKIYTWNHIASHGDLELNIRRIRYLDAQGNDCTRIAMRASNGLEELETQNLSELVRFCNLFDPSSGAEHPVEIAIRSPLIAMRYPKSANTVRRLQMKFRSHEDYQKALTILQDLGLPITSRETAVSAGIPPIPSPAPSVALSNASSSTLRPPSVNDLPRLQDAGPGSSLMKPEFKLPARPEVPLSQDRIYNNLQHITQSFPTLTRSADVSNHAISRVNSMQVPASQSYPSQIGQEMSRHLSYLSQSPNHTTSEMPQMPLYSNQLHNFQQGQSNVQSNLSDSRSQARFISPSDPSLSLMDNPDSTTMSSLNHHRPASAPSLPTTETSYPDLVRSSTVSLPPRRELPFTIPGEPKNTKPSLPRPILSASPILPPSSVAKSIDENVKTTHAPKAAPKKRIAQRKAVTKPGDDVISTERLTLNDHVLAEPDPMSEEPSPLAAKSAAAVGRPMSAPIGLLSKAGAPPRKRTTTPGPPIAKSKTVEQATQTEGLGSPRNASKPGLNPSSTPPNNYLQAINDAIRRHGSQPPLPIELYDDPKWIEMDVEDRARLLDNFICESLDDPDFLKLCEDVDTAWRRIGLNL